MNAYLARRHNVLHGRGESDDPRQSSNRYRERYREPANARASAPGDLSPVVTSLLAPKRRKGEPPAPVASASTSAPSRSPAVLHSTDPASEAASRVASERARAAAILAEKRRKALASTPSASSVASTPRSEYGGNMFNAAETREAQMRRQHQGGGSGRVGWEEMRRRREERERGHGRDRDASGQQRGARR